MSSNAEKFYSAIASFDAYHQNDPSTESEDGNTYPKELLYARRMTERLSQFAPDAEESVKLAARCQHIGRWEIPREKYPMDRKGYLRWRNDEKVHHARIAEEILLTSGYDANTIETVKGLLLKKELHSNASTQLLEDVACLVFIEYYLEEFAGKHADAKVVEILRKTLKKMSARGKETVKQLSLSTKISSLIDQAVVTA